MERSLTYCKFDPVAGDGQGCPRSEPGRVGRARTHLHCYGSLHPFVRIHPYLAQQDLLDFCNEKRIHITAFSPTGKNPLRRVV